jgi:hypothetical protein
MRGLDMQNDSHSLMHVADFGGDPAGANAYSLSAGLLQQLHQDNTRLRMIVAQLLLKNQSLRWQLGGQQSLQMLFASATENELDA